MPNVLYGFRWSREALMRAFSFLSRVLVSCTILTILVMPWTEFFWNADEFAQGKPDFELALLGVLTGFCLLLVLLQLRRKDLQVVMRLRRLLDLLFRAGPMPGGLRIAYGLTLWRGAGTLPVAIPVQYCLPLQI